MSDDTEYLKTWITVQTWLVNAAMPPEEVHFPHDAAEQAIDYARRKSHQMVNQVLVLDGNRMTYAMFAGTWIYTPDDRALAVSATEPGGAQLPGRPS